jgi:signal transduction histidine kinase
MMERNKKQNIPRLLSVFYRVNKSGSRSEGGSGLGLAIVKHIIEAHKEKIRGERIRRRLRIFFTLAKQTGNKQKRLILVV